MRVRLCPDLLRQPRKSLPSLGPTCRTQAWLRDAQGSLLGPHCLSPTHTEALMGKVFSKTYFCQEAGSHQPGASHQGALPSRNDERGQDKDCGKV